MKKLFGFSILLMMFAGSVQAQNLQIEELKKIASTVHEEPFQALPLQSNGRIKPFESLAREAILFLTGSYTFQGMSPISLYFSLMLSPSSTDAELIEIRSPDLREKLGFRRDQRFVSARQLQASQLGAMTQPLLEKDKQNHRGVTEIERKTIETYEQMMVFQQVVDGSQLISTMDPQLMDSKHGQDPNSDPQTVQKLKAVLETVRSGMAVDQIAAGRMMEDYLKAKAVPAELEAQKNMVPNELMYIHLKPFRWACWFYFFLAMFFFFQRIKPIGDIRLWAGISALPLLAVAFGFYLRVSVTGFAPVTNMFGTMLWVSFGVSLFGFLLLLVYKDPALSAILNLGSFALLLLTESMPLILSPDLDPIVAVLRSNLWLTIHVLTITISYAAFTISMILGNTCMIQFLMGSLKEPNLKKFSHYCYRSIQLGVLLISAGIILGGVWADYSWGRFWGWDPKETWALIADLGYIAILHAKFIGWAPPFRLVIFAPLSYLLVVMAWYGVNFILASGLHSYGFSSGGAAIVFTYVAIQLALVGAVILKEKAGFKVGL